METTIYKGYDIIYFGEVGSIHICERSLGVLKTFLSLDEEKGLEEAKKYIDNLYED